MKTSIKRVFWLLSLVFAVTAACFMAGASVKNVAKASDNTFEMVNGASVRFAEEDSGIRFRVRLGEDTYRDIVDNDNVTLKFIITSKANFDSADGDYMAIENKRVAEVNESKIYEEDGYYYANGCLTQIRPNNRAVSLCCIAVKVTDGSIYDYAEINGVGARGSMYDTLNQALLASSKDYVPSIVGTDAFSWYGTEDYPVYINTSADYEKLADKFSTASATALQSLKYNILGEVDADAIDNAAFKENVTTTYKVTFDPANGDAVTTKIYKSGETIVAPADPEKDGDDTYTYSFNGWGEVPATCSASATYTAQYNPVFKNYTVTFKSHDGSITLASKTDYHYGDKITNAPVTGTTYEIAGTTYEIGAYTSDFDTVNGNAEILAASFKCAPKGKEQGLFYVYGDGDVNGGVAPTDTYISFNAHRTLGGITTLNGELVLHRAQVGAAGLDQSSALSLKFATSDILTEIYVPFYIISVSGGSGLDMNMRLYAGNMTTTLPVVFKDAGGNAVDKANLQNRTWYTAVYALSEATANFNQTYKLTMCSTGASVELFYARPYFTLMDGLSVNTFNTEIKDNFATAYAAYNAKTEEVFACDDYNVKSFTYHGGNLLPVYNSGVNLSFSSSVWNQYLDYQQAGGKLMTMDVKFINVGVNAVNYNGEIYNGSGYGAISNAASNSFRQSNKYFRFFNENGDAVNYQNIAFDTWYKMVVNIDAIKKDVGEQITRTYGSKTCSSIFFRSGDDGVAIGNIAFTDSAVLKGDSGIGGSVDYRFEDNELVTVGTSSHQWSYRLSFSDSVWNAYLAAQTAGGKVMQMDIRFGSSVSLSGYLNGSGANLNTYRANTTYFRFYNANGEQVRYADLVAETWYKLVLDIDAIATGIGAQTVYNGKYSSILFARESAGTISLKNVEFVDNQIIFKDAKATNAVYSYYEDDTLITRIDYGSVYKTPFSDAVANAYIDAQNNQTGKVLRFDVKFTGGYTTYNGFIYQNGVTYGNVYMSNNIRGNRNYIRFYGSDGEEVAYGSLAEDTWYKMVVDIDAIKSFSAQDIRTLDGATGLSLRFYANESGESIYVKNAEIVDKADENA